MITNLRYKFVDVFKSDPFFHDILVRFNFEIYTIRWSAHLLTYINQLTHYAMSHITIIKKNQFYIYIYNTLFVLLLFTNLRIAATLCIKFIDDNMTTTLSLHTFGIPIHGNYGNINYKSVCFLDFDLQQWAIWAYYIF